MEFKLKTTLIEKITVNTILGTAMIIPVEQMADYDYQTDSVRT